MNELDKLRRMLKRSGIPFEDYKELRSNNNYLSNDSLETLYGEAGKYSRNQIIYGRNKKDYFKSENCWKFDGICQYGSFGAKEAMIETYGSLGVDSQGEPRVMTAKEAFDIIKRDYDLYKELKKGE